MILLIVLSTVVKNYEFFFGKFIYQKIIILFYIACFGSIGGFLSISINIKKIKFNPHEKKRTYILNSIIRMSIAVVAGLVSYILLKSNFINGIIEKNINNYTYYSIAILSGFSEKFIPNLLNKVEGKMIENKEKE